MNNWIPKNKTLKFAIFVALGSVFLYFLGLFFVIKETKKVESFYHDSESEFSKNERLLAIKSVTEKYQSSIEALREFFIQKGDEVEFIEQIEKAARSSSVDFDMVSIDVKSNPEDGFKEEITVKMGVKGPWNNLMAFTHKLERLPFGVLIKNTTLKAKGAEGWMGFVEFIVFREK